MSFVAFIGKIVLILNAIGMIFVGAAIAYNPFKIELHPIAIDYIRFFGVSLIALGAIAIFVRNEYTSRVNIKKIS